MKKEFISIAVSFFPVLCLSQQLIIPSAVSGNYKNYCAEQWTKRGVLDESMFNYCMSKEREGHQNLVYLAGKYNNMSWIQAAVDYSVGRWTKRDNRQDSMVYHTLNLIIEGYEDIVYMSRQPDWNKAKYSACSAKWGIQFEMVVY